jgi:hypothetical protein
MIDVMDLRNKEERKKPIELLWFVFNSSHNPSLEETTRSTKQFDNIRLISKGLFDVIACWNNETIGSVAVYLGHWNDGVRE